MDRKPQSLTELVAIAEQYLTAHNKKLSSRDLNSKKSICASRQEMKNTDASSATTKRIKRFNCWKL